MSCGRTKRRLSCHYNTPVAWKGNLIGVHGRVEGTPELRCVEWKTGKVLWAKEKFGAATLILTAGPVVAVTDAGDAVLIEPDAKAYKELARHKLLDATVRAQPALAGGRLFARDDAKLVCVELEVV